MNTKLLKSVASLAVVVALGVGATYAAIPSNTVTISGNQATTGNANLKLCNTTGAKDWRETISPNLNAAGLTPGDTTGEELTLGNIFLGNDGGTLNTTNPGVDCTYITGTPGNSDQTLVIIPSIPSTPVCTGGDLTPDDVELRIRVGGRALSGNGGWKTLTELVANTDALATLRVAPDHAQDVEIFARLSETVDDAGANCTFDIDFDGESTTTAPNTSPIP